MFVQSDEAMRECFRPGTDLTGIAHFFGLEGVTASRRRRRVPLELRTTASTDGQGEVWGKELRNKRSYDTLMNVQPQAVVR